MQWKKEKKKKNRIRELNSEVASAAVVQRGVRVVLAEKRIFTQKLEGEGVSHAGPCSLQALTKLCSHGLCCPHGL